MSVWRRIAIACEVSTLKVIRSQTLHERAQTRYRTNRLLIGEIAAIGEGVRNLYIGDRVVIPSTIACGFCSYCRSGYHSQCDNGNPNGAAAGTAFFGGPEPTGPFNGLQAEFARIPYANVGLVKL